MRNFKSIPIPELMDKHCERDPRGIPVPYVILKDKEGKYHFKINDSLKSVRCALNSLCTICGQELPENDAWLVGGIASAFDPQGCYVDLPVHKCCGEYALQVCPYLAIREYDSKIDMEKLKNLFQGDFQLHNPTVDPDRLPLFVFLRPVQLGLRFTHDGGIRVIPINRNYHEVEYWRDGQKISNDQVVNFLTGTKWEKYLETMFP